MPRAKTKKQSKVELDSIYMLKMVAYLVLGSLWFRVSKGQGSTAIPIPAGFILGVWLASKEKFQIDRKLEYAILLVAMFLGFWLPIGISFVY